VTMKSSLKKTGKGAPVMSASRVWFFKSLHHIWSH
jgi:hypothetical protein